MLVSLGTSTACSTRSRQTNNCQGSPFGRKMVHLAPCSCWAERMLQTKRTRPSLQSRHVRNKAHLLRWRLAITSESGLTSA